MDDPIRAYAVLALRLERRFAPGEWVLDYRGPEEWRDDAERPGDPGGAAEELVRALGAVPGRRGEWMREQAGALAVMARRCAGADVPFTDLVRGVLGVEPAWVPDEEFEEAYELLDRALPGGRGSLRARLQKWRAAHLVPPARARNLIETAVREALERTRALVPLPGDVRVDCAYAPGPFRGLHRGGSRGTVFLDRDAPFNAADLLYVVTHEAFPGHIAEFLLKDRLMPERTELKVRFLPAPAYVISEGIGLHALSVAFPDDEAERWLVDYVPEVGPDRGDLAALHRARNLLWAAWGNAALLTARGRPDGEVRAYLADTALFTDDEAAAATAYLGPYVFAYQHGFRLLDGRTGDPAFVRSLLTEQVTLGELTG